MKTINPTLHDKSNDNQSLEADKRTVRHVFKLGLDVDLRNIVVAIQCGNGAIPRAKVFPCAADCVGEGEDRGGTRSPYRV